jgi:hypothetical protein
MKELHNGRSSQPLDRELEGYRWIFFDLISQMENLPNFEEKFYFDNN